MLSMYFCQSTDCTYVRNTARKPEMDQQTVWKDEKVRTELTQKATQSGKAAPPRAS